MKIYFKTLGCEKNTVDSQKAAGLLFEHGHTIVHHQAAADVIIVNTCGFINDAKQESIDAIFDAAAEKTAGQHIIVSGCLSQRYGHKLEKSIPEADVFLGVNDYAALPEILASIDQPPSRVYLSSVSADFQELGSRLRQESIYSASIKIAEGCDNVCTYCSIPFIRGPYRSRNPQAIIAEAQTLAAEGCKELIVIAQDVTAYGSDFQGTGHLPLLLRDLCKIDGIRWIRLMYCYEDKITDELIETIKTEEKICKYLDIPIQHASNAVLKAMNRHSTAESIKATVNKLRKQIPGIAIRTTLISGFPGETRADFLQTVEFVKEMKFQRLGVFAYSKEEGTAAYKMPDQIRKSVKEHRRDHLMAIQREISLRNNQAFIGLKMEVLVEEINEDGSYSGRTFMDAPEIDNSVLFTCGQKLLPGDFAEVTITDAFDYDLVGIVEYGGRDEFAQ